MKVPEGGARAMGTTSRNHEAGGSEVSILARVLGNEEDRLPAAVARYILSVGFSARERARMHDLAVRNQADSLSPAEREELSGYVKAGTLLSILKSRARRALNAKARKRATS
jgi:hypothetical protein